MSTATMTPTANPRYLSCAETSKLVRAALKQEFPTIKFTVRSDTYSGGASIRVGWQDGPTEAMVKRLIRRFEGASFDGMIDLKSYHDGELNGETVHFGADFIFVNRKIGRGLYEQIVPRVAREWGVEAPEIKVSEHDGGAYVERGPFIGDTHADFQTLVYRELQDLAVATDGTLVPVRVK